MSLTYNKTFSLHRAMQVPVIISLCETYDNHYKGDFISDHWRWSICQVCQHSWNIRQCGEFFFVYLQVFQCTVLRHYSHPCNLKYINLIFFLFFIFSLFTHFGNKFVDECQLYELYYILNKHGMQFILVQKFPKISLSKCRKFSFLPCISGHKWMVFDKAHFYWLRKLI